MRRVVLLVLLSGCGYSEIPTCDVTRTPIADDEVTDLGFSASDLLASVAGTRDVAARDQDDAPVDARLSVERGSGSAQLFHSEPATERRPNGQLFGVTVPAIDVQCLDGIEVPTEVQVQAPGVDVDAGALLSGTPDAATVEMTADAEGFSGLPDPGDADPDEAFLLARFSDGTLGRGGVGWQGVDEDEDVVSSWAIWVLEWGDT